MKRIVIVLLSASAFLTGLGLVMLATWQCAHVQGNAECSDSPNALAEQLVGALFGYGLLWVVSRMDYLYWKKVALPFFAMALLLLLGNRMPSVRFEPYPHRMMPIDILGHLQTDVIFAWAGMIFLAWWYGTRRLLHLRWVPFAAVGTLIVVLLASLNFGAVLWLFLAAAPVMILGGARASYVILFAIFVMNGIIWVVAQSSTRIWRLAALLSAGGLRGGARSVCRIAFESGGWTGVGLGRGDWASSGFPSGAGHWVAAHIGEELGLIGLLAMAGLYLAVIVSSVLIAVKTRRGFGKLLGTGIVSLTAASIILNLFTLAAPGYISPPALPFVSYGGFGLCMNLIAVGIMISIAHSDRCAFELELKEGDK